jgi:hypothetical protein
MKQHQVLALSLSVLTITAMAGSAFAGPKTEELQGRQDIQINQIQQGADSGELTKKEVKKLIKGQERINKRAHAAGADDKISRREFHKMEHMQNKESESIAKDLNNSKDANDKAVQDKDTH